MLVLEQSASERARFLIGIKEVFESLELIKDDEVGFKSFKARCCEDAAEFTDHFGAEGSVLGRYLIPRPAKPVGHFVEAGPQVGLPLSPIALDPKLQAVGELGYEGIVDLIFARGCPETLPEPGSVGDPALEQILG